MCQASFLLPGSSVMHLIQLHTSLRTGCVKLDATNDFLPPIMLFQKVATGKIRWQFATYPLGLECPLCSPITFAFVAI